MSKLTWDQTGQRLYETGVDHGVLYPQDDTGKYPLGVPWNGLISVSESPSGAESNPQYADNIKYVDLVSAEEFGCTIEAFTYPPEFAACDGSAEVATGVMLGQQPRKRFGLVYRTLVGNDTQGQEHGYKLHLIYGGLAAPSEKAYNTINDSPEAITFSWEVTSDKVAIPGTNYKPVGSITIDSTKVPAAKLALLEAELFGSETETANLPLPEEVIALVGTAG